jgi:predicted dehydrogenase
VSTPESRKARVAVIGTGWWATDAHIPSLVENPDAEIAAICDVNPEKVRAAAEAYGIASTYTDYRAMLAREEMDAAIIVTPHATHYEIARDCLRAGLHILIEKPMTLYAKEARDLVTLAEQQGREILVGYPYPYLPLALHAREVLRSGELGAVQYLTGTFASDVRNFLGGQVSKDFSPIAKYRLHSPGEDYNKPHLLGGGQGHLQITHLLGLLFFLSDIRIQRVHALMANHGLALDLIDAITVEFENGSLGMIGGTGNAGKNYKLGLTIYCENGAVDLDTVSQLAVIRRSDGSREDLHFERNTVESRFIPARNLVGVALGKEANGAPGEVGWRAVELLDAAYRSARDDGRSVRRDELYN